MTEPMELAKVAKAVHTANWKVRRVDGVIGMVDVTLRGGNESELARDFGTLNKYLTEAGEISVRLLRPDTGVVIGQVFKMLEDVLGVSLMVDADKMDLVVERLTAILRGEDHA
jgi:hypothetical protein